MVLRLLLRAERRQGARAHLAVLAMLAGVAAALTLAAVIGRMADEPWERTWRATGSPHLTVFGNTHEELGRGIARVPGVTASSGPIETGFTGVHAGKLARRDAARRDAAGRPRAARARGGRRHRLDVRAQLRAPARCPHRRHRARRAARREERVSGLAVVSDQEPYPFGQPGLTFGPEALLDAVVPADGPRFAYASLRLADPSAAPAVAEQLQRMGEREFGAQSWQSQRADVGERLESVRIALELLSLLLILCSAPIVATIVSERILARGREFAILRAGGLTPRGIITLTGVVYGVLGLAGGLLGLAGGTLIAPLVTARARGADRVARRRRAGARGGGRHRRRHRLLAAASASLPAWLISRRPATEALAAATGGGRRRPSRLARAARAARLPVAAVIGVGDAFARRPRALMASIALALSIAAVIGAVSMEADFANQPTAQAPGERLTSADSGGEPFDFVSSDDDEIQRLRGIVYPGVAMLLALGLANLVAVLALALREGRHDTGVLRAVGLTPRDAALTVVWRQLTLALARPCSASRSGSGSGGSGRRWAAPRTSATRPPCAGRHGSRDGRCRDARHGAAGAPGGAAARDNGATPGVGD